MLKEKNGSFSGWAELSITLNQSKPISQPVAAMYFILIIQGNSFHVEFKQKNFWHLLKSGGWGKGESDLITPQLCY